MKANKSISITPKLMTGQSTVPPTATHERISIRKKNDINHVADPELRSGASFFEACRTYTASLHTLTPKI